VTNEAMAPIEAPAVPAWTGTFGALLRTEVHAFVGGTRSLAWTALVPVLVLFLGYLLDQGHPHTTTTTFANTAIALATGVVVLGLFGYATTLATYRERGVFERLRCTPVPPCQLLGARLLVQLLGMAVQGVILFAVVRLVYGVAPSASGALLVAAATLLGGLASLALGQLVVALVRTASSASAVARAVFILMMLLVNLQLYDITLPAPLALIADLNPVRMLQELLLKALVGQHWGVGEVPYLIGLVAWLVVAGAVALRGFRWEAN
jgi:ABC-2 type transport system permease protein